MVATWGGYVFVLNMIGLHAAMLVAMGRFTTKVYWSYTLFYVVGTLLAIQIPVVGLTPLKSLEQLGCLAVFLGYQVLFVTESLVKRLKVSGMDAWKLRVKIVLIVFVSCTALALCFLPRNYFGPISSRVRGLFVKHTKTGNPLVDSVGEHQPANPNTYYQYLHQLCFYSPLGFIAVLMNFGDSPSFLSAYALAAYYFSLKMVRLILLTGPIAAILGGIVVGRVFVWSCTHLIGSNGQERSVEKLNRKVSSKKFNTRSTIMMSWPARIIAVSFIGYGCYTFILFRDYCWSCSEQISGNISIIQRGRSNSGETLYNKDTLDAYNWIRENTPEDSRVMAWWDYGYQITAIANRTTIADGNTWNHEHIALLGKIFITNVDEAHSIARHLADYFLVFSNGGGDDLAKSPHIGRVANSVYRDLCGPQDPTCSSIFTAVVSYVIMFGITHHYKFLHLNLVADYIAYPKRTRASHGRAWIYAFS